MGLDIKLKFAKQIVNENKIINKYYFNNYYHTYI